MATNNKRAAAHGIPSMNNGKSVQTCLPSEPLTFKDVIHDVASWWCYAILKTGDLKLFDELDTILESLPVPFPVSSPLSIRLRCLVPWQEFLLQLYTPGRSVGEKKFETVQDKLLLLHQGFFPKSPAKKEFSDVLRMVQTHSVLSKLYNYFSKGEGAHNDQEHLTNKILEQCNAEWESIYLESDSIPASLLDLTDKTNGWDFEDRRDHILQIVSFPDSPLTYQRLKKKMQSLLLFWFEREIYDSDEAIKRVPELLRKRYRGIGYGDKESASIDTDDVSTISHRSARTLQETIVVTSPIAQNQQNFNSSQMVTGRQQRQQPVSKEKRNQQAIPAMESTDVGDCFDKDPEEELRKLKLRRQRKKRFLHFSQEQKVATGRQMEELLSMPVGEPSYSEASPRKKKVTRRKRRRRNDSTSIIATTRVGSKNERARSKNLSTSSSSGNDFSDNDEEAILWTQEEDEALINGIKWNGYGNWGVILKKEKRLLGSKDEKKLGDRANQLLAH